MDIVKRYATIDNRIKYIESEKNIGPMVAREKGYKVSKGDYITFVDSDDTLVPDALEILYYKAKESSADFVSGGIVRINADGTKTYSIKNDCEGTYCKKEIFRKLLNNGYAHNLCAKLYKGDLIRNGGFLNQEKLTNGEDGFLFYQIVAKSSKSVSIRDIVYEYWMIETSSTHKPLTKEMVQSMALFEKYRYDILSKELGNITFDFYKSLYPKIADLAKRIPIDEIKNIYNSLGIQLNLSFFNTLRYMSISQAVKCYIKIHLYLRIMNFKLL